MITEDITNEFPPHRARINGVERFEDTQIRFIKELHPLIGGGFREETFRVCELIKKGKEGERYPFGITTNTISRNLLSTKWPSGYENE